jgi:hypothetical protein
MGAEFGLGFDAGFGRCNVPRGKHARTGQFATGWFDLGSSVAL